jgi:hypothetical protein
VAILRDEGCVTNACCHLRGDCWLGRVPHRRQARSSCPLGLQAHLDTARQELAEARQRSSAREQELQAELKLLGLRSEAEARALRERLEAALSAQSAAAAAAAERDAGREAAAAAARREAEAAATEARRLQEELRRWGGRGLDGCL